MVWKYLSIPKLQRWNRWSLGMDKLFHTTLYSACDYLSMLGLKSSGVVQYVNQTGGQTYVVPPGSVIVQPEVAGGSHQATSAGPQWPSEHYPEGSDHQGPAAHQDHLNSGKSQAWISNAYQDRFKSICAKSPLKLRHELIATAHNLSLYLLLIHALNSILVN